MKTFLSVLLAVAFIGGLVWILHITTGWPR